MACTYRDGKNTRIDKRGTFLKVLGKGLPGPDDTISDLIDQMDAAVRKEYSATTTGALSNAHGDWYEWLLAIIAWNTHAKFKTKCVALKLPNISRFDVSELYCDELHKMIVHLRSEVMDASAVKMITSNPDFVVVNHPKAASIKLPQPITTVNPKLLDNIEAAYKLFCGECDFESIRAYVAAKFSFRPDRRLQVPHEGSLMKALYVHLQTRLWITQPDGLKYYAVAAKVKEPDRIALSTVATHSITTVMSVPQAAVDRVFETHRIRDIESSFQTILNS
ncbi:MAG: Cfr10I/Bse634I family restriction endonuclease [Armatimonadetes bacterium]|nr:Cfr10I/Bse634I family restriction endonuclease [Armatimonadota bacterium]